MAISKFRRGGKGVFKCMACGHMTRVTGDNGSVDSNYCEPCFDNAGLINHLSDSGQASLVKNYSAAVLHNCRTILSKGGKLDGDAHELLRALGVTADDLVLNMKRAKVAKVAKPRKAGRPKITDRETGVNVSVYLMPSEIAALKALGNDNLSLGISMACAMRKQAN